MSLENNFVENWIFFSMKVIRVYSIPRKENSVRNFLNSNFKISYKKKKKDKERFAIGAGNNQRLFAISVRLNIAYPFPCFPPKLFAPHSFIRGARFFGRATRAALDNCAESRNPFKGCNFVASNSSFWLRPPPLLSSPSTLSADAPPSRSPRFGYAPRVYRTIGKPVTRVLRKLRVFA